MPHCIKYTSLCGAIVTLLILASHNYTQVNAQYYPSECYWDCEIIYCDYYHEHCDYDCYEVCYPYRTATNLARITQNQMPTSNLTKHSITEPLPDSTDFYESSSAHPSSSSTRSDTKTQTVAKTAEKSRSAERTGKLNDSIDGLRFLSM